MRKIYFLLVIVFTSGAHGIRISRQQHSEVQGKQHCFALPGRDTFLRNSEFLPDPFKSSVELDADASAVQAQILARSKNCSARSAMVSMYRYGLGSSVSSVLKPFNNMWKKGGFIYTPRRYSSHQGILDWSQWGLSHTMPDCEHTAAFSETLLANPPGKPGSDNSLEYSQTMPEEFYEKGNFWWTGQQLAFLLRPQKFLADDMEALKTSLNWEEMRPILGMHIRHGDSCRNQKPKKKFRTCESLDKYMLQARRLHQIYGYKSIYLATDDPDLISETKKYPEFIWLHNPLLEQRKPLTDENYEKARDHGRIDEVQEAHEFLKDVYLLADADGFVGKFSSNIDRLVVALSYGQKRCAFPHASLDAYWCNDYKHFSGYNPVLNKSFLC